MRRLLLIGLACLCSAVLEVGVALLAPVPLTDDFVGRLVQQKLDRAAAVSDRPKLVVFAGSNALFSHRCEVLEPILGRPCVNAGVAVGVGLDYLFARWEKLLHPGDVVYLPMEGPQYTRSRAQNRIGPETSVMLHHDWRTLARLPPDRQLAALFSVDLRSAVMGALTLTARAAQVPDTFERTRHEFNAWGDRVGHTAAEAAGAKGELDHVQGSEPAAAEIEAGYGTGLIAGFVRWAAAHDVTAIGGLPTGFDDIPMPDAAIAAIRAVYERNGGRFLLLPNHSRYPRHDFFDTRYHLYEACQIRHSVLVADALAPMLGVMPRPAPGWAASAPCPGFGVSATAEAAPPAPVN